MKDSKRRTVKPNKTKRRPPKVESRQTYGRMERTFSTAGLDVAANRAPMKRLMSLSKSGEKNPLWHFQSNSFKVPRSSVRSISIVPPIVFNFDRLPVPGSEDSDDEKKLSFLTRYPRKLSLMPEDPRRQSTLSEVQMRHLQLTDGLRKPSTWGEGQRKQSTWGEGQRKQSTWGEGQRKQSTWGEGQRKQSTWGEGQRKQSTWNEDQRKQSTWNEGQRKQSTWSDDQRRQSNLAKRQTSFGSKGLLKPPLWHEGLRKQSDRPRPQPSVLYVPGMQRIPETGWAQHVRQLNLQGGKPESTAISADRAGTRRITRNIYQAFLNNSTIRAPGGARNMMLDDLGYGGEGTYTTILQRCSQKSRRQRDNERLVLATLGELPMALSVCLL